MKQKRDIQIYDLAVATAFTALGLAALGAAIFAGAWHHLASAAACAVIVSACVREYKKAH